MALSTTLQHPSGITVDSSYVRITRFLGDKNEVEVFVSWFASEEARQSNKAALQEATFVVPYPVGDLLPGLYTALKSLDTFSEAQDV